MKKLKLFALMAAMVAFTACSDDDDPKNLGTEAAGSYTGYTVASSKYFSDMVAADQTVNVTSTEINKVNISFVSDTWGTITINGAELTGESGSIAIKGSGKSMMGHAGSAAKEYDCTAEGRLEGKVLTMTFNCPTVMGGLSIVFNQGEVPADIVVPGTYKGYTEAKSAYFSGMMADNQELTLTKNTDDTYKVAYTSDTWGEFTIESAAVKYAGGKFELAGEGKTKMGMGGNIKEYDCSLAATIDASKEMPEFTFTVPTVMGGLTIVFKTGTMPSEV